MEGGGKKSGVLRLESAKWRAPRLRILGMIFESMGISNLKFNQYFGSRSGLDPDPHWIRIQEGKNDI
jgi:hypothetical protein